MLLPPLPLLLGCYTQPFTKDNNKPSYPVGLSRRQRDYASLYIFICSYSLSAARRVNSTQSTEIVSFISIVQYFFVLSPVAYSACIVSSADRVDPNRRPRTRPQTKEETLFFLFFLFLLFDLTSVSTILVSRLVCRLLGFFLAASCVPF